MGTTYPTPATATFAAGTIARCNRCNEKSPLPREIAAQHDSVDAYRLREMCTLEACGHMDGHWVFLRDNRQ